MLSKFLRYSLRVVFLTIGIKAAVWAIFWAYVNLNEASLIAKLSSNIKERTRGETRIGGLSVSIFRTFPLLSLQLKNVLLRDSLYGIHKKDFLKAENIYLRLSIPGLISGRSPLGKIIISDGAINIVTDSSGVTNSYIFKPDQNHANKETDPYPFLPEIALRKVLFSFVNPLKAKFHQLAINKLNCSVKNRNELYELSISVDMLVKSLAFNTAKGSYIKDKQVNGDFGLIVDGKKKDLLIDDVQLEIENHPFFFKGKFRLDKASPDFNLSIEVKDIDYFIIHQANQRITNAIMNKLDLPPEKVPSNIEEQGNTSAASIPILLSQLVKIGKFKKGQKLLLAGFGGGISWGTAILEWKL